MMKPQNPKVWLNKISSGQDFSITCRLRGRGRFSAIFRHGIFQVSHMQNKREHLKTPTYTLPEAGRETLPYTMGGGREGLHSLHRR